jgi:hypothetical protein
MSAREAAVPVPRTIRVISWLLAACAVAAGAMTAATVAAWAHFAPAADLYRRIATDPPDEVERTLAEVRGPLIFGGLVSLVILLLWAWLAIAARVPRRRRAQITAWAGSVAGIALLLVDLNGGLVNTGSDAGIGVTPRDLLGYDLAPDWYPGLNGVLGILTIVVMAAGALALTRSGVIDYYRAASWQKDDRWSAFVTDQKDRIADGS